MGDAPSSQATSDPSKGNRKPKARDDRREERDSNPITLIAAIVANLAIAVAKFFAATVSQSAALFAEGVHSLIDTANDVLLLFGHRRSRRPADADHPFGYGKEVYFWTMIYSVLLFGIGGGVSIFKGVTQLRHPVETGHFGWSYAVLGVALVAEGISWTIAVRKVHREGRGRSFLAKLRKSRDPSRFVVVGEDSAAILGVLVAFVGVGLTQLTGSVVPDALASIAIGLLLCVAAVFMTLQTKELLVGLSADRRVVAGIKELTDRLEDVEYSGPPLTMHLGPHEVLAALDIKFRPNMTAASVARCVDVLEAKIRERFPDITRIYIEAQLAPGDVELEQPDKLELPVDEAPAE